MPAVNPARRASGLAIGVAGLAAALLAALPAAALAHGDEAPAPTIPGVLLAWTFEPLPILGVVIAAAAYWWAAQRVAAAHPDNPPSPWRTAAFLGGLTAILVALISPIEAYEGVLFSVHMAQHMLLELVAAPLLLLGAPVTLALRAASPSVRSGLLAVLHSRVVAVISFPLLAWLLFAAVNWGWHFSTLYNDALENDALHYLQHGTFLGAALLFWWPVVAADPARWRLPHPARLFYLFLAMPQNSFLGVALMGASSVLYPHYQAVVRDWGPSAIADQGIGGILMWVVGDIAFLVGMGAVVVAWVRQEDRRTARLDARLDAEERLRSDAEPASRVEAG
jgi:putative copper resistance protein D